MHEAPTVIDTYLAAYGEPDPTRRRSLIQQSWSPDGTMTDPPLDACGHDGIDAMFAAVQGQFPGQVFRRTSDVDCHHGVARYGWVLVDSSGSVTLAGTDFVRFADDGRLAQVAGFFGPLTPIDA